MSGVVVGAVMAALNSWPVFAAEEDAAEAPTPQEQLLAEAELDSHYRRGVSYNNKDVRNKYARGLARDGDRKLDYRGRGGKQVATAAALSSARAPAATRGLISAKDLVATKADPERGRRRVKARSRISANDPTRGGQS
jgi:hypothetical protein